MENVYLATCWHTGTKYFKAGLEAQYRVSYSRFNRKVLEQIQHYEKVFTTYRDPKRVAASWANRGHFSGKKDLSVISKVWVDQWECYRDCLKTMPMILDFTQGREQYGIIFPEKAINSHADQLGLHKAIDNKEYDKLYQIVPKELIDLAEEVTEHLREKP